MSRLFIYRDLNINDQIVVSGEDVHHIIRVLRHRPGDVIRISDGRNTESIGVILDVDARRLEIKLKIVEKNKHNEIKPFITLLLSLPKGDKFDWILQKNTEIGVSKFIPIVTQRTVVNVAQSKLTRRRERWKRIVQEAAKQCMRMDVPEVGQVLTLDSGLQEIKNHELTVIPWEQENKTTLKKIMKDIDKIISRIAVFIGPEGGFSIDEIERAKAAGAVSISLGSRILRTETAAV